MNQSIQDNVEPEKIRNNKDLYRFSLFQTFLFFNLYDLYRVCLKERE